MEPPPSAMGVPPAHPDMNRNIMNCAVEVLRALPITNATKTRLAT